MRLHWNELVGNQRGSLDPPPLLGTPKSGAFSPGMGTAGDSGNPKWRLLGYKLPQCALGVRTKGCHLAGRQSCGGRSRGDAERPGLPEQAMRPWPGRHLVRVPFQGSDSLDPTVFKEQDACRTRTLV